MRYPTTIMQIALHDVFVVEVSHMRPKGPKLLWARSLRSLQGQKGLAIFGLENLRSLL